MKIVTHRIPTVGQLMQPHVICVPHDMAVDEVAHLLTDKHISGAPVIDTEGDVIGVVSMADIVAMAVVPRLELQPDRRRPTYYRDLWMEEELAGGFSVEQVGTELLARDVMTPVVYQVNENDSLTEAVKVMLSTSIHRAIVTDGENVVGILTTMDLIRAIPDLVSMLESPEG